MPIREQGAAGQGLGLTESASACVTPGGKVSPPRTCVLKGILYCKGRQGTQVTLLLPLFSSLLPNVFAWTLESDRPGFKVQFYCLIN